MLLDTQLKFSDVQALTATAISTNVVDLRNAATPLVVDEGLAANIWLEIHIITSAAGGDAAKTITFTLESDSTADLATAPTVHYTSAAVAGSGVVAGNVPVRIKIPSGLYKRYLGVRYTVSAGFTSFTLTAFVGLGTQRNTIYPTGFSVS